MIKNFVIDTISMGILAGLHHTKDTCMNQGLVEINGETENKL